MSQKPDCPGEKPFFIVGNPRSGTTLLTFILSSHPRLHVPGETGFLPELMSFTNGELTRSRAREVVLKIGRLNRVWNGLVEDFDKFYDDLPSKTLSCLLDRLYFLRIKDFGSLRWGDKTPSYVRHIPQIAEIFPNAQFVHVIRDGRDASISALKKWGYSSWYMDFHYLLMNWRNNVSLGRTNGKKLGNERYLEIRYEKLVKEPEEVIEIICTFLGEIPVSEMLNHTSLAREIVTPYGHTEVREEINTLSVERWRRELSSFDKLMAYKVIGNQLKILGYPVENCRPMTLMEKGKFRYYAIKYWIISLIRHNLYKFNIYSLNRKKSATYS